MVEILHQVTIEAPSRKVYEALTQQAGIEGWWSQTATVKPEVGHTNIIEFYGGQARFELKVDQLDNGEFVKWSVQQIVGPPDWKGTYITWKLEESDGKTTLHFGHHNFASTEGSYAMVNFSWAGYIKSLKDFVETGQGDPYTIN